MQRRLVLIRHARAQDRNVAGDHERSLTQDGRRDATALGGWLAGRGLVPDHVIVSTAVRAGETLAALADGTGGGPLPEGSTWTDRRIYDGGTDGVLAAIGEVPAEATTLWVVGHEPVMSTTAWELANPSALADDLRDELSSGFSTASAAVLETDEEWAALGFSGARLAALHTARAD